MAEVQFTIRIEKALKDEFVRVAQSQDMTASQVLRMYMRDYIRQEKPEAGYSEWLDSKVARSTKQMNDGQVLSAEEISARFDRWKRR